MKGRNKGGNKGTKKERQIKEEEEDRRSIHGAKLTERESENLQPP